MYARGAAERRVRDKDSRLATEKTHASFLKRRAAQRATRQWEGDKAKRNRRRRTFRLPGPSSKPRVRLYLLTAHMAALGRFYQLLSGYAMTPPSLKEGYVLIGSD